MKLIKCFLADSKIEKFAFLKESKRIPRVKSNKELYYYTESSILLPDNLDALTKTIFTSEI